MVRIEGNETLRPFCLGETEVSVKQFRRCVEAKACRDFDAQFDFDAKKATWTHVDESLWRLDDCREERRFEKMPSRAFAWFENPREIDLAIPRDEQLEVPSKPLDRLGCKVDAVLRRSLDERLAERVATQRRAGARPTR